MVKVMCCQSPLGRVWFCCAPHCSVALSTMKKLAAGLLCVFLAFLALASRQMTDDTGHNVTLSDSVNRIAEGWYAHQSLLMTLGVGDNIVATVNRPDTRP